MSVVGELAQSAPPYTAWNVSSVGTGNGQTKNSDGYNYGICEDFRTVRLILLTHLSLSDSGSDINRGQSKTDSPITLMPRA
jgi:hypothetical protein